MIAKGSNKKTFIFKESSKERQVKKTNHINNQQQDFQIGINIRRKICTQVMGQKGTEWGTMARVLRGGPSEETREL